MKVKISLFSVLILGCSLALAQSTIISPGNNQPNIISSSINSGVFVPKISLGTSLLSPSPTTSPQEGMLIYNNGSAQPHGFYFWTGSAWASIGIALSSITAAAPITIQSNVVKLNAGTSIGQLITWDGSNWVNTSPKPSATITNTQPYLAINYCISLFGVFPSQSDSNPYVGDICLFGFNFAPNGWAACNGQLMSIAENETLFQLIGTLYGGNGQTTFGLPDLRGRVPIHVGQGPGLSNYTQGQFGGAENRTINDKY
jgi:microcystin-dependent protein